MDYKNTNTSSPSPSKSALDDTINRFQVELLRMNESSKTIITQTAKIKEFRNTVSDTPTKSSTLSECEGLIGIINSMIAEMSRYNTELFEVAGALVDIAG